MLTRLLRILALPLTTTLAIGALGVALVVAPLLMRRDSSPPLPTGLVCISDIGTPIDRGLLAEPTHEPTPKPDTITVPRRWGHWSEGDEVVATFPAEDFDCACYRYDPRAGGCLAGECWRTDEEQTRGPVYARGAWRARTTRMRSDGLIPDAGICTGECGSVKVRYDASTSSYRIDSDPRTVLR